MGKTPSLGMMFNLLNTIQVEVNLFDPNLYKCNQPNFVNLPCLHSSAYLVIRYHQTDEQTGLDICGTKLVDQIRKQKYRLCRCQEMASLDVR